MEKNRPDFYNRKSARHISHDYTATASYFVTINCKLKEQYFGLVEKNKCLLNDVGKLTESCLIQMPLKFPNVCLGRFIIMPDHIHAVIHFKRIYTRNFSSDSMFKGNGEHGTSKSLGSFIRSFKNDVHKSVRANGLPKVEWQRSFHDRIIRNKEELNKIEGYILTNPQRYDL